MTFDRRRLVGTWQLVRWYITYEDGSVSEPLGAGAAGQLVYTADGWMSAGLMAAGRPRLARGNPRSAPLEQRAAAFDSFFAYAGRWRVVDRSVEHTVTLSHNPALVGTVQVRRVQLRGRRLTLSAEETLPAGLRVHRLQWRPAGPAWPARVRRPPGGAGAGRRSST